MHTFEFEYASNRLAKLWDDPWQVPVEVAVEYITFEATAYDTPFGSAKSPSVGNVRVTSVWSRGHDLMSLKESDIDFALELLSEVRKREGKMLEHAAK